MVPTNCKSNMPSMIQRFVAPAQGFAWMPVGVPVANPVYARARPALSRCQR
jgi:hypothetical protein